MGMAGVPISDGEMRSPYAPIVGHRVVTNAEVVPITHAPRITYRQPLLCAEGAGSAPSSPHQSGRSPTENRKVGGSTPPLATTVAAGQTTSDLQSCLSSGLRSHRLTDPE